MSHRFLVTVPVLCAVLLLPTASKAADGGLAIRAGTQGLGVEGGVQLNKYVLLRGGVYGFDVSTDFDEGGIDYDGDLKLGGYGVLVDFFPIDGNLRFTAGLFSNRNELDIVARPFENVEIGGTVYTPAEVGKLTGAVDFDTTAPYAGFGWGNLAQGKRFGFIFDAGFLFQGSGEVTLRSDSPLVDPDDLAAEIEEIEDEVDDYDFWPVISFGVAFRF
jgi:hypothetical protein